MKYTKTPYIFDEFFASGKEESVSPFLTPSSRLWGKNLPLKSALLSAVFLVFAYGLSIFSLPLKGLPLLFVYFLSGTPALISALEDLKKLEINIDVLMTLAALLSVAIGSPLEGGLLLVLFELSASMEKSVAHKTKGTLARLHELSPRVAFLLDGENIVEKSVKDIKPGMRLLIKAGEMVPLDSKVLSGSSFVALKHLTGEHAPIGKCPGDEIPAGAYNLDGTLTVEVLRSSADSTLSRIIKLITEAHTVKPRLEKFLDRFGKGYAITIILLTLLFALSLPLFFHLDYLGKEGSIYRSLTFLVAASPCALIIGAPTAYLSAINSCAKRGILLKGGMIFDALTKCKWIAFDKTGTLTLGKLKCTDLIRLQGKEGEISFDEALSYAATLEQHTTHPIGRAICELAKEKKLSLHPLENFCSFPGLGVEGTLLHKEKKQKTLIGSFRFIEQKAPELLKMASAEHMEKSVAATKTSTFLAIGAHLLTIILDDEIRPGAKECIDALKKMFHFNIVMLSGDKNISALHIAHSIGIEEVLADLSPEDKLDKVALFSQQGGLIMVGDGINDAPALARASVGISLGKIGSATAIEASDVVFMNDDLSSIPWLLQKASKTKKIIVQNLTLALVVIFFATTPALLGLIPLWLAVVLHEGGTLLVGLNSLRLLRK